MNEEPLVLNLASAVGLAVEYVQIGGAHRRVPTKTLRAVLEALGYPARGPALRDSLRDLADRRHSAMTPRALASFEPDPPCLAVNPAALHGEVLEWVLGGEGIELAGATAVADLVAGQGGLLLPLPPLTPGYYRLRLACGSVAGACLLVRAPARAWYPAVRERAYGVSVQLYEQLGGGSVGIGDFGDLAALGEALGRMGVSTLGLNPLHALFLSAPERASPYSPNSRLALNPLYLDLRGALGERGDAALRARVEALNAASLIDYAGAAEVKLKLAREAYADVQRRGGNPQFTNYPGQTPRGVHDWARYETIAAAFGADWRAWPAPLCDPESEFVAKYIAERRATYEFHLWLQWLADLQLGDAARAAASAGMGIGLYHDLALGADPAGAELWAGQRDFAKALSVGAPPDPLNPSGQNWGIPPVAPQRLMESDFAPFIELVRGNMRHAGALRIDHVLGLNRLFVIPADTGAADGAYLAYPFDVLLAIVVLESVRAGCAVVGEDLGTVPAGFSERLGRRGILSLRLLYFERDELGRPQTAEAYPREALVAVGTHDLAPLAGFWRGEDIARMTRLGLWPSDEARAAAEARRPQDCALLRESFARVAIPGAEAEVPSAPVYRWLARTPSRLLMIQPEDALEVSDPVNVPGTTGEEPNWRRRRLPPWPEWICDPRFVEVLRAVQAERGGPPVRHGAAHIATYRLQLHREFGFGHAARLVPYLARLGISHLYVSPIMRAVPGSQHGYDVTDPTQLDEDRGGEEGFEGLIAALNEAGLRLVVDFVPNHMAAHPQNSWWMDVLEWGLSSRYGASFDVDWGSGEGKLVVPLLEASLETILAEQQIALAFEASSRLVADYHEQQLPLAPATVAPLLRFAARRLPGEARRDLARLAFRLKEIERLPAAAQRSTGLVLKAALARLAADRRVAEAIALACRRWASDARHLGRLLARQHWRLVYWRHGLEEINYRRFFDIASLAALRMERPAVFAAAHTQVRRLISRGSVAGLRLDHVDGLAVPGRYLEALARLAEAHGGGLSLWVEKILGRDESLSPWPVAGTTGYEFLNSVTRLFTDPGGCERLRELWRGIAADHSSFSETLGRAKREVIVELFEPTLARVVDSLAPRAPVAPERLRLALVEALVALPIYRGYSESPGGAAAFHSSGLTEATAAASMVDPVAGEWLAQLLAAPYADEARLPAALRDGVARFWQLASAAMAKGLEDTAFYRDLALLALNEVGGDPRLAHLPVDVFHSLMLERVRLWPLALNASETHDTKRGEDARMRLALLSAHAETWAGLVADLRLVSSPLRPARLDPADEYLVWQTLLAIWPPDADGRLEPARSGRLAERSRRYLVKALREAKLRSSWTVPDSVYEKLLTDYAKTLLDVRHGRDFQGRFAPFAARLARSGALASLAAVALKLTAPGVPDLYQGSELWDLSLVDPDNRRPVDFRCRQALLDALETPPASRASPAGASRLVELMNHWADGRIKLFLLTRLLALRRARPHTFAAGYRPLSVTGARAGHVVAFARGDKTAEEVLVVIARVAPSLEARRVFGLDAAAWGDAVIATGKEGKVWREIITGARFRAGTVRVGELLAPLPVAVLVGEK